MVGIDGKNINLTGLDNFNLILGRNGCGKSRLLKSIHKHFKKEEIEAHATYENNNLTSSHMPRSIISRYVQPERGERIDYNLHVTDYDSDWEDPDNPPEAEPEPHLFRYITHDRFRKNLRAIPSYTNDARQKYLILKDYCMAFINEALKFIRLELDNDFNIKIYKKNTNIFLSAKEISSGENELISIWMELIRFALFEGTFGGRTFLLLDEIDLHLHPDAQLELINFIYELSTKIDPNNSTLQIIIVTHSTAILSALADKENTSVCFMKSDSNLEFVALSDTQEASTTNIVKLMLPIFGAHPLTQVFNDKPVLLVEGEDDERIWQQAVRSSEGKLKIFPREVGGTSKISPLEDKLDQVLVSIYDNPVAFTLRDRDDIKEDTDVPLANQGSVIRLRLYCRAAENLLITDDVIKAIGRKYKIGKNIDLNWNDVSQEINHWLEIQKIAAKKHPKYKHMEHFVTTENNRKSVDIKQIRNLLLQIIEDAINRKKSIILGRELNDDECITVNTDWEILVGQAIGLLVKGELKPEYTENSILQYLGNEIIKKLLKIPIEPRVYLKTTKCFVVWESWNVGVASKKTSSTPETYPLK